MSPETEASQNSDHLQHDHSAEPLVTDTAYKCVPWIETFTGRAFAPLHPKIEAVSIIDIAHSLANQCRYSGATQHFYSTAQHCCVLADYVLQTRKGTMLDALQILLHDSAEAYLVDIPRPVKQFMPEYRKWDKDITFVIRDWAGLGALPIPEWQDELDSRIISDERAQLMSDSGLDWEHRGAALGVNIDPWLPRAAEQNFLMRYAQYSSAVHGSIQYLRSGWGIPTNSAFTPDFRTRGGDVVQKGPVDPKIITDLMEVDVRGGVGRVALRSPDGMMIRDLDSGSFPRPAWKFIHGKFELTLKGKDNGLG